MRRSEPAPSSRGSARRRQAVDPGRLRRRPPTWLAALVLVPLLLGWVAADRTKSGVERDLVARTTTSLARGGVTGVDITADGRNLRLTVPDGVDRDRAERLAHDVSGVGDVTVQP